MNITVIIPVYNAERFLEKAVNSALQFEEVKEILLCEDFSPDHSLAICKELVKKDSRIKLFQHPDKGNHGAGATRNLGLENATQEFVAFLDADDYYLPYRFDAEKELFKNDKIEGVFNAIGVDFLTEKGKEEYNIKFKDETLTTVKRLGEGMDIFHGLLGLHNDFGTFFHLNGLTVRNSSISREKLLFNPDLKVHQDQDFITKLAYHCNLKSGNISTAVAMRGIHDDNRITKIVAYSEAYKQRQHLLWDSLAKWSIDKNISKEHRQHILLQSRAYRLSVMENPAKQMAIFKEVLRNPRILKTRYRFLYLGK